MFLRKVFPPVIPAIDCRIFSSRPLSTKLDIVGLIILPWGIPETVSMNSSSNLLTFCIAPLWSHSSRTALCTEGNGMFSLIQSWLILSKKPFMSASSTHFHSRPDCILVLTAATAFLAPRYGRKPKL